MPAWSDQCKTCVRQPELFRATSRTHFAMAQSSSWRMQVTCLRAQTTTANGASAGGLKPVTIFVTNAWTSAKITRAIPLSNTTIRSVHKCLPPTSCSGCQGAALKQQQSVQMRARAAAPGTRIARLPLEVSLPLHEHAYSTCGCCSTHTVPLLPQVRHVLQVTLRLHLSHCQPGC